MLAKGTKLLSFSYRIYRFGKSNGAVFFIRGVSQSAVFKRLYFRFCFDCDLFIEIRECPSGKVVYDGSVGRLGSY